MAAATADKVRCDKCKEDVANDDCFMVNKGLVERSGRAPIWRCKSCNCVQTQVAKIKADHPELVAGFTAMSPDAKSDIYKACQGQLLPGIKKVLQEETMRSESASIEASATEAPEAISVAEAEKLPMFVANPGALEKLCSSDGMTFVCKHTGVNMVYVPKYSKKSTEASKRTSTWSQVLSGEVKITVPKDNCQGICQGAIFQTSAPDKHTQWL